MSADMREGGCFCGALGQRTTVAPQRVSACNCRWCQKRTGGALRISVYIDKHDPAFAHSKPDWMISPHAIEVRERMPR